MTSTLTNIRRLNNRLGADLGRTIDNRPLYKWIWSEDPTLMHGMRIPDKYDWKANESGVLAAIPVYESRKLCLSATNQWVLCHWIESPPEHEWVQIFGYNLEWPKGGQYYPTNVALDPGTDPDLTLTQVAIECIRAEHSKRPADVAQAATEAIDYKEKKDKERLFDEIRDDCTTYDHVPGRRDQVSYPAPQEVSK